MRGQISRYAGCVSRPTEGARYETDEAGSSCFTPPRAPRAQTPVRRVMRHSPGLGRGAFARDLNSSDRACQPRWPSVASGRRARGNRQPDRCPTQVEQLQALVRPHVGDCSSRTSRSSRNSRRLARSTDQSECGRAETYRAGIPGSCRIAMPPVSARSVPRLYRKHEWRLTRLCGSHPCRE